MPTGVIVNSPKSVRSGTLAELYERRKDVEQGRRAEDLAAARASCLVAERSGQPHDERHARQLLVQRLAVRPPEVLVELLSVVGDEDDDRVLEDSTSLQLVDQLPELAREAKDAAVILLHEFPRRFRRERHCPVKRQD